MKLDINGFDIELMFIVRTADEEFPAPEPELNDGIYEFNNDIINFRFSLSDDFCYSIDMDANVPASVKISLKLNEEKNLYHLIPCNIHGDNNLKNAKPGFFPNLTYEHPDSISTSDQWEFRADRASHPVSIIACDSGAIGISIDPYSEDLNSADDFIRNGLFSRLPSETGVSLGYRNFPSTFTFKEMMTEPTYNLTKKARACGKIFAIMGKGRLSVSDIIRNLYYEYRECPSPGFDTASYLNGFLDSYENINWSQEMNAFTNQKCRLPESPELKPWRPLIAVGWTGTGVMVYPLLSAQLFVGSDNDFTKKLCGLFDEMSGRINPRTGLFFDLIRPWNGSDVNGWWAGYIVKDCHCAYTNGNGIFYLLKSYKLLKNNGSAGNNHWLKSALTALDAAVSMQQPDGCFGYTYSLSKPEILDYDGFAGCWFAASCALAYSITGQIHYLQSAEKGISFYYEFVKNLDCWGSPMDTWKSIDQEGNLAFIRAAVLLHKATKNPLYLQMAVHGAQYEYLWRYSFKARPEFRPLKNSAWNSCGGSVTSVSNPHIHPMGVNITAELLYIYMETKDIYHFHRAMDGLFWGLSTADMYPDVTGYGRLGVVTERYCPSDGLAIETYSDTGEPSGIWFTFNGWAGVSILEGLTETLLFAAEQNIELQTADIYEIFDIIKTEAIK